MSIKYTGITPSQKPESVLLKDAREGRAYILVSDSKRELPRVLFFPAGMYALSLYPDSPDADPIIMSRVNDKTEVIEANVEIIFKGAKL